MPFIIIDIETGRPLSELVPLYPHIHDTGDEAQAYAKDLSQRYNGRKFKVKKVLDDRWKQREQAKFDSGEYTHVPWVSDAWWGVVSHIHHHHYPHASYKEPGKLAYTESPEKGMDNIHTQIKPGRYLETYFGKYLKNNGYSIHELALQFARAFEPRILRFAKTEDEVQFVYENGPSSCMSSHRYRHDHGWGFPDRGQWPKDIHACRMYIAGDLELAYIVDDDKKFDKKRSSATIIARSVVWPAKKTHSRVYGDEARMRGLMEAAGYKFGPPIGARLQRISINDNGVLRFIAPYIDAGLRSGEGSLGIIDKKTHLEITDRKSDYYQCGNTGGVTSHKIDRNGRQVENNPHCDACDEDDVDTNRVYDGRLNDNGNRRFSNWCSECIDHREAFYCDYDHRWYDSQEVNSVVMANGGRWSARAFGAAGFLCQGNGGRYPRNERVTLEHGRILWSVDYFNEHGFVCDATGNAHSLDDLVKMDNGQRWSREGLEQYGFTCPQCNGNFHREMRHKEKGEDVFLCRKCHPATAAEYKARQVEEASQRAKVEAAMNSMIRPLPPEWDAPASLQQLRVRPDPAWSSYTRTVHPTGVPPSSDAPITGAPRPSVWTGQGSVSSEIHQAHERRILAQMANLMGDDGLIPNPVPAPSPVQAPYPVQASHIFLNEASAIHETIDEEDVNELHDLGD